MKTIIIATIATIALSTQAIADEYVQGYYTPNGIYVEPHVRYEKNQSLAGIYVQPRPSYYITVRRNELSMPSLDQYNDSRNYENTSIRKE